MKTNVTLNIMIPSASGIAQLDSSEDRFLQGLECLLLVFYIHSPNISRVTTYHTMPLAWVCLHPFWMLNLLIISRITRTCTFFNHHSHDIPPTIVSQQMECLKIGPYLLRNIISRPFIPCSLRLLNARVVPHLSESFSKQ